MTTIYILLIFAVFALADRHGNQALAITRELAKWIRRH